MKISKELQNINKDDLLVSIDFNSLYPSVQIDLNSTWTIKEVSYPFENCMSDVIVVCLTAEDEMN